MRGQSQASAARLGSTPARERIATWADERVRKRRAQQARELELVAALAAERRHSRRRSGVGPGMNSHRLPY